MSENLKLLAASAGVSPQNDKFIHSQCLITSVAFSRGFSGQVGLAEEKTWGRGNDMSLVVSYELGSFLSRQTKEV